MVEKSLRTNARIEVATVRVISSDGKQIGVMPTREAIKLAERQGVDLVEMLPHASPPVCRLLDYGKYKFEQARKQRESRRRQSQFKLKEIRMQPKIGQHDLEFKARRVSEFLGEGNKVKVTVRFRGREMVYTDMGKQVIQRVMDELSVGYAIEKPVNMEGRFMSVIVRPTAKRKPTVPQKENNED